MKKRTLTGLLLAVCLGMAGCNGADVTSGKDTAEAVSSAAKSIWDSIEPEKYVTLGNYKGLEVTRLSTAVSEEDIEAQLMDSVESFLTAKEVTDRDIIKDGDIVNINFVGKRDGKAFEGGTAEDFDLTIGSGMFIPGFEEGLLGKKVGEKTELNLTFPDHYPNDESLQGQPVVFEVTINSIKEKPEITDEAVKKATDGAFKSVEAYKESIKEELEKNAVEYADSAMYIDLWQQVLDSSELKTDPPKELIDIKNETIRKNAESFAQSYGMDWDGYLNQVMGMTQEEFEKQAADYARDGAKESLVLMALAKAENIEVTPEEISKATKEYVELYNYESVQDFMESINMDDFKEYILMSKVKEFLADQAVIKSED